MRCSASWLGVLFLIAPLLATPGRGEEAAAEEMAISAEAEDAAIRAAIGRYIEGTSYNRPEQILSAFYKEADLFLSHPEKEIWILPITDYAGGFAKREAGKFNGRKGKVLSVDRTNDIATAKAEIGFVDNDVLYIDVFLLKKVSGEWKIISKAATRLDG